ncbi:MAG: DUF6483 family protein [Myxococcota bacterium]
MAIRQDLIMKMIEQLAETFQRIFAGDSHEDPERAIIELETALAEVFRTRRELLFMKPMQMIEEFDGRLNAEVGHVFVEHARLSQELGRHQHARRSYRLAIEALRRGVGVDLQTSEKNANDVLRQLLRGDVGPRFLSTEEMADLWREIFETEAAAQRFDLAEDALFHAIDLAADPQDHIARGIRHYQTLKEFDEQQLEDAGLPIAEVDATLAELESLS